MNNIIESTILTLQKSKYLLNKLSNEELSDCSVSPYYSSIGSHIRHIYDFYDCFLKPNKDGKVDLTSRKRNFSVENCCDSATNYLNDIIKRLHELENSIDKPIIVIDDLGTGKVDINYTYAALISQANSHTIHHYAIIGYILDRLKISIDDLDFGFNPSTPKETIINLN